MNSIDLVCLDLFYITIAQMYNHFRRFTFAFILALSAQLLIAQPARMPAEWEQQERVYLSWFGRERRDSVSCRVVQALLPHVAITINLQQESLLAAVKNKLRAYSIDPEQIQFVIDSSADFWTRDPFLFIQKKNKQLSVVQFRYTMYGAYPDLLGEPPPRDILLVGEYGERLAARLQLPLIKSDYVFEAGGIESNGKGTIMLIREMALQRNPGKTIEAIELELKRVTGARKIIWLKEGLAEDRIYKNYGPFYKNYFGGGANMHIDELCRFTDAHTVILPYITEADARKSPVDSLNFAMLEDNLAILRSATTADGKKLRIFRFPMPEAETLKYVQVIDPSNQFEVKEWGFKPGDTIYRVPAASYMNYFVSNKVVLIPKYWMPGMPESQQQKDEMARQLFVQLFPGRTIIPIFALSINRGGGGIHCMTHEQPR